MFVDEAIVRVKAGKGGNGAVAFRREKFVPRGGPSGGNGGRGGNVIFQVDPNLNTLVDYQYRPFIQAENGGNGGAGNKQGRAGADVILPVPPGTLIRDAETGEVLADLTGAPGQERFLAARGGRGGRGNAAFATARNQAPAFAENGEPGEERRLHLELKVLADVGLVGYPNVGKSTLISRVSAARPKIADYPFTTLVPHLGVVRLDNWKNLVMADIPGLIEGAHLGHGLGHQFLRHIERTRVLIHMLDVSGTTGRDPLQDYRTVNQELAAHSAHLASLPQIIALNKIDLPGARDLAQQVQAALAREGHRVFAISALTGEGVPPLIQAAAEALEKARATEAQAPPPEPPVLTRPPHIPRVQPFTVQRLSDTEYVVLGRGVERMVAMADLKHQDGLRALQKKLEKAGVFERLRAAGVEEGNTVRIGDLEFTFVEEEAMYQRWEQRAQPRHVRGGKGTKE